MHASTHVGVIRPTCLSHSRLVARCHCPRNQSLHVTTQDNELRSQYITSRSVIARLAMRHTHEHGCEQCGGSSARHYCNTVDPLHTVCQTAGDAAVLQGVFRWLFVERFVNTTVLLTSLSMQFVTGCWFQTKQLHSLCVSLAAHTYQGGRAILLRLETLHACVDPVSDVWLSPHTSCHGATNTVAAVGIDTLVEAAHSAHRSLLQNNVWVGLYTVDGMKTKLKPFQRGLTA
jgi:hypothetical protein